MTEALWCPLMHNTTLMVGISRKHVPLPLWCDSKPQSFSQNQAEARSCAHPFSLTSSVLPSKITNVRILISESASWEPKLRHRALLSKSGAVSFLKEVLLGEAVDKYIGTIQ